MLHKDAATVHADAIRQNAQHEMLMKEIAALRSEIAALRAAGKPGP